MDIENLYYYSITVEWYSPEYRWGHTLEVPVSLR